MISVVIPACNEEKTIKKTINELSILLKKKKIDHKILVVEDGSSDKTVEIVEKMSKSNSNVALIHHEKRLGKGRAVRIGFEKSGGDLILTYDADGSMPAEELNKLMDKMEDEACVVIGSRYSTGAKLVEKRMRILFSRIFNIFFRLLFFNVKDTQSGYKLINRKALDIILPHLKHNGFEWDVEFLKLAKEHGVIIKEVPIRWMHQEKLNVDPVADGLKMFFSLIKIRLGL